MSNEQINLNPDLARLIDAGYSIEIVGNVLMVKDVPYVTSSSSVATGTLAMRMLPDAEGKRFSMPDHQAGIIGDFPCDQNGQPLLGIRHSENQDLGSGIVVNHYFSNKIHGRPPERPYHDHFEKVESYLRVIMSPVMVIDPNATAKTRLRPVFHQMASAFQYYDTASIRAGIANMTACFNGLKIAIVGLGGTGSYVLDQVAKTPVAEICLVDGDHFELHNAFRAPGAPSIEELQGRPLKVDYFARLYGKMHKSIRTVPEFVTDENVGMLTTGFHFVFLCIDSPAVRGVVSRALIAASVPFIDVGMSVSKNEDDLSGLLRSTYCPANAAEHFGECASTADAGEQDLYRSNIQIADLNALNAMMAVLQWKKHCGFYADRGRSRHQVFTTSRALMANQHSLDRQEAGANAAQ